ncbi:hypothetical protein BMS3Bbin12_00350 [bacterium BMS3Bbin12]|nr:hypothetical protein BMS3Bbin12_00350 [bacterium BMS3Bbin12]GBE49610.1 hypothetical protein BMS3Bbin13_00530 [bacterium BMS3Bbin13]
MSGGRHDLVIVGGGIHGAGAEIRRGGAMLANPLTHRFPPRSPMHPPERGVRPPVFRAPIP